MSDHTGRQQQPPGQPQWGHSPYAPPPVPKKRRTWLWVLLAVLILMVGGCVAVVVSIGKEVSKEVTVTYEVTGNASNVAITYSTWHDDDVSTSQETVRSLPWRKKQNTSGLAKGGTLTVTTGESGGQVKCSVVVGNGKPKTATASGPFTTASCSGF